MAKTLSNKATVQILVQQCVKHGLRELVISPGSRNAPLIVSFNAISEIKCYAVVDERSAGFFALGMAQQLKRPVAILCTSGTAALNYAPAVAEAYYQEIPLLILTADRPTEWLGQADGQTIPQSNLFNNFVRFQATLPIEAIHNDDQWYTHRVVSEAFLNANSEVAGPVHINIPLREPLYDKEELKSYTHKAISELRPALVLSQQQILGLAKEWNTAKSVMIICGVNFPDEELSKAIDVLLRNSNTVVLTETTSNLYSARIIKCIDRQIFSLSEEEAGLFAPELLISFGGQIVSKQVKMFLRNNPPKAQWHISLNDEVIDTFQHLSMAIKMNSIAFLNQLGSQVKNNDSNFQEVWALHAKKTKKWHKQYVEQVEWSDLKAMSHILTQIPANTNLQLANSTPVRYAQLFQDEISVSTFSNRGTSGIDGTVSTAVGAAWVTNHPTLLVTGDMSFFYDSNGLWNKYLKPDFKIVMLNNGGGGIFRFIPGPSQTEELEEFFEAKHSQSAKFIAKAYSVKYLSCSNEKELHESYQELMDSNEQPTLLEIFTPGEINGEILRGYFNSLKSK